MNSLQRPALTDEVAFQVTFNGFLQKLDRAAAGATRSTDGVGRFQTLTAQKEPVVGIGLVRLHASRKPRRQM